MVIAVVYDYDDIKNNYKLIVVDLKNKWNKNPLSIFIAVGNMISKNSSDRELTVILIPAT